MLAVAAQATMGATKARFLASDEAGKRGDAAPREPLHWIFSKHGAAGPYVFLLFGAATVLGVVSKAEKLGDGATALLVATVVALAGAVMWVRAAYPFGGSAAESGPSYSAVSETAASSEL